MSTLAWIIVGGVLIHGGWSKRRALLFNVLSGLTFLTGASDLVPEVNKHQDLKANAVHLVAFVLGLALLFLTKVMIDS